MKFRNSRRMKFIVIAVSEFTWRPRSIDQITKKCLVGRFYNKIIFITFFQRLTRYSDIELSRNGECWETDEVSKGEKPRNLKNLYPMERTFDFSL